MVVFTLFVAFLFVLWIVPEVIGVRVQSCSEILRTVVHSSLHRSLIIKSQYIPSPNTFVSLFNNAKNNDGTICWETVNKNRRQQRVHQRSKESNSSIKLKHHRLKYHRVYDPNVARSSKWFNDYVKHIDSWAGVNNRKAVKFRRRFRMPVAAFLQLIKWIEEEEWFPWCHRCDALGNLPVPVELLVLGCLRYLGRGWTFDDLEECTGISEETHRIFFHKFVRECRIRLGAKFIVAPETDEDIADCMAEFTEAGKLPSCRSYIQIVPELMSNT